MYRSLRIALILISLPALLSAQFIPHQTLTERDGLSDNRITCFLKDQTGFMWIGTENGLNRYDGHQFVIYRPGQSQRRISHEHINDVAQDRTGRLWIATWSGLNVLDPTTDSLHVFTPDDDAYRQKASGIASSITWDIYIDKTDRIWLALDVRDLCYYDPTTKTFSYFPWHNFVEEQLPAYRSSYKSIQKIHRKSEDELWLGTTLGLFSFKLTTGEFRFHGGERPYDFTSFYYDEESGRAYFGQESLFRYEVGEDRLVRYDSLNEPYLFDLNRELIAMPTLNELWLIDTRTGKGYIQPINERRGFSLHHEKVHAVFQDGETLWLGTNHGITIHDRNLSAFPFIKVFSDTLAQSSGNVFHVLDHQADGLYYISSYTQNCLILMDKRSGRQQSIYNLQGRPLTMCAKTYEDRSHHLWILTDRTIFLSDESHTKFSIFPFPTDASHKFNDMVEDKEGIFWFSSLLDGVYQYNPNKQTWKLLRHKPDGLFATRPTALLLNPRHNSLWISDFSFGAFIFDFQTRQFIYNGMDTNNPDLLQSSLATSLTLDKDHNVWVATTSGGVSKYVQKDKRFVTYSMATGLPENTIHSIQADHNGNLWLATRKGLTCMKPTGEIIRHYDKLNGLPYNDFTTPFSVNAEGELLIGVANGFLKFNPDSLRTDSPEFPTVITRWMQDTTLLPLVSGLDFSYAQSDFTFTFSALTYSLPQQTRYFYKLEGYNNEWVSAGNAHTAQYTNLNDGTYSFLVKAIDYNGRESLSSPLSFTIQPPYWKRSGFLGTLFAVAVIAAYAGWRRLERNVKSQKLLNQIATSLYSQNTVEDVFWKVASSCIELLKFEDCVVYQVLDNNKLVQKAAAGPKSASSYQIVNPIEIPLGRGIVGAVALNGRAEIIRDTRKDERYIVDDRRRLSEIAVPIVVDGKVFGVIDSEHSSPNFFTRWHLSMLTSIAGICSAKIGRYFIEESVRSKVARDLHDDIGSNLSSIKIMSNIAIGKQDPAIIQNYLKSIRQNVNAMQESMSDMVWAINPENDTMDKVIVRMRQFAAEILEPLDIRYEFKEQGDFTHMPLSLNTRKDFYLIFKEAVNNAAKYSRCQVLQISLTRESKCFVLSIEDDGQGFDPTQVHAGNGLKNMRHRAKTIGAELNIASRPGAGTCILVKLPIT